MSSFRSGRSIGTAVLSTLVLSALAACGGGGNNNGGDSGTPPPPAPAMSRLTLTGTVTDAPIPGAVVTATIGSQSFTATADANGNYRLELSVEESAAGGFITLQATGVGSQSYVEFTSLLGTFQALKTQAGSDGVLSSSENFATQITNVSTALATLLRHANGGQPVASQTLIDTLTSTLHAQQILELAVAIKLLVDEPDDYPMPSGLNSLQALLSDTTAREQLVTDFFERDPATFNNVQHAIVNDTTLIQPATNATLLSTLTAVLLTDNDATTYTEPNRAVSYTFNTDGTGTASAGIWHRNITWSISGASVDIIYETPVSLDGWERKICSDYSSDYGYLNHAISYDVNGAKLALLNERVLAITETRHVTYRSCGSGPASDVATVAHIIYSAEDFQPIDPAELHDATRTMWVYDMPIDQEHVTFGIVPDLAQFHADGTGTTQEHGKHFTWSLDTSGRIVNVTFDDGVTATFRALRQIDDVATDLLLEFTLPTGRLVEAGASLRTDLHPELAFTRDNTIGRHYRFGIDDPPIVPGAKGNRWRFDADGFGSRESEPLNSSGVVIVADRSTMPDWGYRWYLDGNDLIQQYTDNGCDLQIDPLCFVSHDLRITPLARVGTRTYVLESWRFGQPDIDREFGRFSAITYYEHEPLGASD